MYPAVLFLCSVGILYIRGCEGGYCTQYYACSYRCYRQTTYYTSCGWLWLSRCRRYRSALDTCYKQCSRSVCCTGYEGSNCSQPICFGSTSCPNGGACRAPDTCRCRSGFSGTNCSDINECSSGTARCDHTCTNTQGSFRCSCKSGYSSSSDGRLCSDINECSSGTARCDHTCSNTQGSFRCSCESGYTLASDGRTCSDINECSSGTAKCNQTYSLRGTDDQTYENPEIIHHGKSHIHQH